MDFKKKLAVVLSAATALMSAVPALGVSGSDALYGGFIKGDIDMNGTVGTSDIVAVSNYLTGKGELTEDQLIIADMNDDGVVNIFDQILIRRTALEIREVDEIPATEPTTEEPSYEPTETPTEAPTEAPTFDPTTVPVTDPTEPVTTEAVTDVTEVETTEATEVVTTIVTEEVTTVATDVTEEVTTEATEAVTTIVTEEVTTAGTTVVTTAGTEAVTTIATEEVTTEGTTVVTTAETEVVTTLETEPVTTVVTTTEEVVTYAFPYEANIDPENTGSVDGVKFAVSADEGIVYSGAVQFFVDGENFDVNYSNSDAVDGVITVNTPDDIDKTAVTLIKICKYWQSDNEASVVLTDVKVIIDGEETAPYTEPAKTADSAAAMMGVLGSNEFWSVDKLPEGSVVPTVTENGTYTAKLVLNEGTETVDFLIIALDGLKAEDFADLKITVDSIKVDGEVLTTADLSKAFIDTGYKEGSFDGTRIYLTDTWTGTMAAAVPTDTVIENSIEVTFTVSGIND